MLVAIAIVVCLVIAYYFVRSVAREIAERDQSFRARAIRETQARFRDFHGGLQ